MRHVAACSMPNDRRRVPRSIEEGGEISDSRRYRWRYSWNLEYVLGLYFYMFSWFCRVENPAAAMHFFLPK